MSWLEEIQELSHRRKLVQRMGGPPGVARQRKRGKLTVRERIDALADPGSLREIRSLVGSGTYEDDRLVSMVCLSRMPWCTVVVGRLFGVAGQCQHRPSGMFQRYCWPSAILCLP